MIAGTMRRLVAQSDRRGAGILVSAMVATTALAATPAPVRAQETTGADALGAFGPEGPRLREQFWMVPSADDASPLRATVFRPPGANGERHPLVVINHGTSEATRLSVSMPVYYWLSRWFVERGYVVLLPQRRGHGATGGRMVESIGTCAEPDHYRSGLAAAADIEAAIGYMASQPFVDPGRTVVVGVSSGGWASLALAARRPAGVRSVISFAGGRGARAFGRTDGSVCGEAGLVAAAKAYGEAARVPTLWLYAENDSYFRPRTARALAGAWRSGGGAADLHVFEPYGTEGHALADDRAGWALWGSTIEEFLARDRTSPVASLATPPRDSPVVDAPAIDEPVFAAREASAVSSSGGESAD